MRVLCFISCPQITDYKAGRSRRDIRAWPGYDKSNTFVSIGLSLTYPEFSGNVNHFQCSWTWPIKITLFRATSTGGRGL